MSGPFALGRMWMLASVGEQGRVGKVGVVVDEGFQPLGVGPSAADSGSPRLRIPRNLDSDSSASRSLIPGRRSASERSDAVKRLLSVSQTCRLQSRSLFAYLSDVLDARPHEHPAALLT